MTEQAEHTLINTFTPRPGMADRLLELQLQEIESLGDTASATGWLGNTIYRATDGVALVIVTRFRSEEAKAQWQASPDFAAHLDRIAPLVESVNSMPVRLAGAFQGTEPGAGDDTPLRLAVILGSTREGRFGDKPADWIAGKARQAGFDVTVIDLRDVPLPFLGDPAATDAQTRAATDFAASLSAFDAFLFTVAEYNHAPTAVLKNALDHGDWSRRPAGLVGYGGVGGARAVEHVRGIAVELEMPTMQAAVHITMSDYLPVSKGETQLSDLLHLEGSADRMLAQLDWWARALRTARRAG
ncbi:MAG: NAD(P)H-dependent oxidoreductase [Roseovarius sp.]|uniref:NAD(P)H-dependent oxidoreductase n=1 Tax=Roseovarius sp. TaxID=1486281 RepID=UPI0032EF8FF2